MSVAISNSNLQQIPLIRCVSLQYQCIKMTVLQHGHSAKMYVCVCAPNMPGLIFSDFCFNPLHIKGTVSLTAWNTLFFTQLTTI